MARRDGTRLWLIAALAVTPLMAACSKSNDTADDAAENTAAPTAMADNATIPTTTAVTPAAVSADSVDTMGGQKFADYKGDATAGAAVFTACKTCHVIDPGVNRVGPSLHGVVGRKAGSVPGFHYSNANKNSGITWTEAKLFQYLEKPQRVVPGTLMTYAGVPDPQRRADVIAYLKSNS